MPKPQRILIVDDNHEIVRATSLRLTYAGFDTTSAFDGEQGVASAMADHPDAILLDVQMPVKDGLAALCELQRREETRNIPVVMLSASIMEQQAALDAGARYYLRKPYEGGNLVKTIEAVLAT